MSWPTRLATSNLLPAPCKAKLQHPTTRQSTPHKSRPRARVYPAASRRSRYRWASGARHRRLRGQQVARRGRSAHPILGGNTMTSLSPEDIDLLRSQVPIGILMPDDETLRLVAVTDGVVEAHFGTTAESVTTNDGIVFWFDASDARRRGQPDGHTQPAFRVGLFGPHCAITAWHRSGDRPPRRPPTRTDTRANESLSSGV